MLSGHTRKYFSSITGISMATLRAWEEPIAERKGLTKKGADRLIKAFYECGIYCSKNWLLSGDGPGPSVVNMVPNPILFNEEVTWGEEESILKDIESFKSNNHDPIVAIVPDGAMLPKYSYGDYVAGNKKYGNDIKMLIGLNCIVEVNNKTLIRKIITDESGYVLMAINQDPSITSPIISNINLNFAAEIVWHRWRERIKDITI